MIPVPVVYIIQSEHGRMGYAAPVDMARHLPYVSDARDWTVGALEDGVKANGLSGTRSGLESKIGGQEG